MKNLILFAALLCSISSFSQSTDEAAVKALFPKETQAFYARDWNGWANCWGHESYITWSSGNDHLKYTGWEALEKFMRENFSAYPKPFWKGSISLKDWNFHQNNNMALATYTQVMTADSTNVTTEAFGSCVCEKIGGEWKIIGMAGFYDNVNYMMLNELLKGLCYAEEKGESPELYARAATEWEKKNQGMGTFTISGLFESMEWSYNSLQLEVEKEEISDSHFVMKRKDIGKFKDLDSYFKWWGNRGSLVERYFREYWKTQADAYGFNYEAQEEGDSVVETIRKK